jgi:putative hydrolase of the HAD superfamily
MSTPINTVFFDMDETLIEHQRPTLDICRDTFSAFEDQLDGVEFDDFIKVLWEKASDMWAMMTDNVLSGDIGRIYTYKNTLRYLKADESLAEAMRERFEVEMLNATVVADHAVSVLDELRDSGYTVGMITNGYTAMQSRKVKYHKLDEHLDHIFISEAMKAHKPDAHIFHGALKVTDSKPENAVHIGDNLSADIAGAIGAGLQGILFDPKGERVKKLDDDPSMVSPSHVISCFREVPGLVST